MRLTNFLLYNVFSPKLFVCIIQQRLKYWVKFLGFFLSKPPQEKLIIGHSDYYVNTDFGVGREQATFYFSIQKYFFYFLLLKFFFGAVSKKKLLKKFSILDNETSFTQKNALDISNSFSAEETKTQNSAIAIESTVDQITVLKNSRTLFFVTTTAQEWLLKTFFCKTEHLIIRFTPDIIANRKFFYKMLFGFHKERKNIAYPRKAYKKARAADSVLFRGWAGSEFFRDAFFFNKTRKDFVVFFKIATLKIKNANFFFYALAIFLRTVNVFKSVYEELSASINLKKKSQMILVKNFPFYSINCNNYFLITDYLIKTFAQAFILFVTRFFVIFWAKFHNLLFNDIKKKQQSYYFTAEKLRVGAPISRFDVINKNKVHFWRKIRLFLNFKKRSTESGAQLLKLFTNFYSSAARQLGSMVFNYNFLFKHQLFFSKHIFDKQTQLIKNPEIVTYKQNLINKVMLLKFLPINLVVLFASSVNKQLLRDVFRMRLPTILISSMEHLNFSSDYAYPGNSFEFNILYFYMRFLIELIVPKQ